MPYRPTRSKRREVIPPPPNTPEGRDRLDSFMIFWSLVSRDQVPDHFDMEFLAECWPTYKDSVLAYWRRNHPGTRPWSYHQFQGDRYAVSASEREEMDKHRETREAIAQLSVEGARAMIAPWRYPTVEV